MPLSQTYDDIREAVSLFVGYGRNLTVANANAAWSRDLDEIMKSGFREFYYPPAIGQGEKGAGGGSGGGGRHQWSFLIKDATIGTTASSSFSDDLPADFSRLVGRITYVDDTGSRALGLISEGEIRAINGFGVESGLPKYAAVQHSGTAYRLLLHPQPSTTPDLLIRYAYEPTTELTGSNVPPGGAVHSETIQQACLAAAEKHLNPEGGDGIHRQRFMEALASSIDSDRNLVAGVSEEAGIWPTDSLGSGQTLGITKTYLKRLIGKLSGFGPAQNAWTHGQASEVEEALRSGLRKFYHPPAIPGERRQHQWSFLRPTQDLVMTAGTHLYDLPVDFAMLEGPLVFDPGDSVLYPNVQVVSETQVLKYLQFENTSYRPTVAAIRPKVASNSDETAGTRFEILFYPVPDENYTLHYAYQVNPYYLNDDDGLPLGGQPHAETVIAACLSATEQLRGITPERHGKRFLELLSASVDQDRQLSSPTSLGYNGDRSDGYEGWGGYGLQEYRREVDGDVTPYNGQTYY